MSLGATQKQKMALTAEMMMKGATLLKEACPRCGAVQIKFQGHTYCTAEDDLWNALSPEGTNPPNPDKNKSDVSEKRASQIEDLNQLKQMLEEKLATVSKQLETSSDVEEQSKLLDLISKYVETLEKLKKSS